MDITPRTYIEISLNKLKRNYRALLSLTKSTIVPVLKSNAYGMGLIPVAQALSKENVKNFAVGNLEESFLLRDNNIEGTMWVLNPILDREIKEAIKARFIFPVYDRSFLKEIIRTTNRRNRRVPVHIEIDTGIGRAGIPFTEAPRRLFELFNCPEIEIKGIFTHFADVEKDLGFSREQIARFLKVISPFSQNSSLKIHIANSAGFIALQESHNSAPFNMARIGILLYGCVPQVYNRVLNPKVQEILKVKTRVLRIASIKKGTTVGYGLTFRAQKKMKLATISIGYAGGFARTISNTGEVLIKGKRAKVVGRISMDLTCVDVTHISDVKKGDEVIIIGKQGKEEIKTEEVAKWTGTIPYEILTSMGNSLPKKYLDDQKEEYL